MTVTLLIVTSVINFRFYRCNFFLLTKWEWGGGWLSFFFFYWGKETGAELQWQRWSISSTCFSLRHWMEEWVGVERESRGSVLFPNTWACIRDLWGEKPHYRDIVAIRVWRKRRNRGIIQWLILDFSAIMAQFFRASFVALSFCFYILTEDKVTFKITVFVQPLWNCRAGEFTMAQHLMSVSNRWWMMSSSIGPTLMCVIYRLR